MTNNQTPFFDIIAGSGKDTQRLGRAWLNVKDGQSSLSIEMSSMPLPLVPVHLMDTEKHGEREADNYTVKAPIEREGQKTYWHPVGQIQRVHKGRAAYRVDFSSIPLSGKLAAFEADR